ncbi:hypothetical protein FHT86_005823 [Rhizobium sp. BK313]|uniref:DUF3540 domain-containing protein n=1 Tax=Rhizobium sp. BK313 TaxID=2587081 RepID=UPI00105C44FB|nr:DUF3540 domain-containing protein [Rhizobium sp. BK313]MBB3457505.1 hypothetical protein [Rhizobium sp. BK313]
MTGPMTSRSAVQHAATMIQPAASAGGLIRGTVKTLMTVTEAGVETDAGESVHARQAASCLLAPAIGDRVLLCMIGGETYILAVLERESQHAAEISVPGARKVTISAGEKLELNAPSMSLAARQLTLLARNMAQTGQFLTSNFKTIVETVVDKTIGARSLTTKAEIRTAIITEVEMLNAGTLVQNIDTVATQNSEIALVTAQRDVRLDAERVSVG